MKPVKMDNPMFIEYLSQLINRTYKILPIYESSSERQQLSKYIKSLLYELYGLIESVSALEKSADFLSYCATLESLLKDVVSSGDNKSIIKAETFKAINLITRIRSSLSLGGDI